MTPSHLPKGKKPSDRIEELHKISLSQEKVPMNPLENILWDLACRIEAVTKYLDEQSTNQKEMK